MSTDADYLVWPYACSRISSDFGSRSGPMHLRFGRILSSFSTRNLFKLRIFIQLIEPRCMPVCLTKGSPEAVPNSSFRLSTHPHPRPASQRRRTAAAVTSFHLQTLRRISRADPLLVDASRKMMRLTVSPPLSLRRPHPSHRSSSPSSKARRLAPVAKKLKRLARLLRMTLRERSQRRPSLRSELSSRSSWHLLRSQRQLDLTLSILLAPLPLVEPSTTRPTKKVEVATRGLNGVGSRVTVSCLVARSFTPSSLVRPSRSLVSSPCHGDI